MNTNPTLIMALAARYASQAALSANAPPIHPSELSRLAVRIYPDDSGGFYFVSAKNAGRWYWIDNAGADHFTRADVDRVEGAINSNARVQITGGHGRSYGIWRTWGEFVEAINACEEAGND